jgi:hypothetical protein
MTSHSRHNGKERLGGRVPLEQFGQLQPAAAVF